MTYEQQTGRFYSDSGWLFGTGFAGNGEGKNNPSMQHIKNKGPLPCGSYKIGKPYDSPHTGPFTIPLEPFPENEMYGRSDFKIHGINARNPEMSSEGRICLPFKSRKEIAASTDKTLQVI
jgi:hypothetical protein